MILSNHQHFLLIATISALYLGTALLSYRHALNTAVQLPNLDTSKKGIDLIIFSYDRPLQLYALLESIEANIQGIESCTVLYRTSCEQFSDAYNHIKARWPTITYLQQGIKPTQDFKPLLLQAFKQGTSPYICFAVDDIIVKQKIDLTHATACLDKTNAYAFFLRLGTHLDYCYNLDRAQQLPEHICLQNSIICWQFNKGEYDWNFAHTVDMTIYRKTDIIKNFVVIDYTNPNTLEGKWSRYTKTVGTQKGLCFHTSIIVNIPVNLVQEVCKNRTMNGESTHDLLKQFDRGLKIDIKPLYAIANKSCHMAYQFTYTKRDDSPQH